MVGRYLVPLGAILLVGLLASSVSGQCIRNETFPLRLPTSFLPSYYYLALQPDFTSQAFSGVITFNATTTATTDCLILHALGLELSTVTEVSTKATSSNFTYEIDNQWVVITFSKPFSAGRTVTFSVPFQGKINGNDATGFFSSGTEMTFGPLLSAAERRLVYNKPTTDPVELHNRPHLLEKYHQTRRQRSALEKKKMYATQFEPTYARMAFPCFDEPAFKAIWQAEFTVPSNQNLTVLFNSPEQGVKRNSDGTETWTFIPMPHPMANYLVAYAIGELEYKEQNADGVRHRIYTPIGGVKYVDFSLQNTINVLKYFGSLWNFTFPLVKLDQIAVPAIQSDAMENFGLCTYDPSFLLIDPGNNDLLELELVASVVVHELSHQWFGDTVTLPWWSETYLNEGFARFLQYVGVDFLYPQWYLDTLAAPMLSFYGFVYNPALAADITGTSGPTVSPQSYISGNQSSAKFSFGFMSYSKGGALNKMFSNYLGDANWNKGLGLQVNSHKWTNPDYVMLLNSLDEASGQNNYDKFASWLLQPGFPLVTVSYHPHISPTTVYITQQPVTTYYISEKSVWWLNAQASVQNLESGKELLTTLDTFSINSTLFLPHRLSLDDCFHLNSNYTGFFLTRYEHPGMAHMFASKAAAKSTPLPLRFQMVSELFHVVNLFPQDYNVAMDLTANMIRNPTDTQTWKLILDTWLRFEQINSLNGADLLGAMLMPLRTMVGWRGNDPTGIRSSLMFSSVFYGAIDAITSALQIYADHAVNRRALPSDISSAVYYTVVRYGGTEGFTAIYNEYSKLPANETAAKAQLLTMLASAPSLDTCHQILYSWKIPQWAVVGTSIWMLKYNFDCRDLAFQYTLNNAASWTTAGQQVTDAWKLLGADPDKVGQVKQFFAQNPDYVSMPMQTNTLAWMAINANLANTQWE